MQKIMAKKIPVSTTLVETASCRLREQSTPLHYLYGPSTATNAVQGSLTADCWGHQSANVGRNLLSIHRIFIKMHTTPMQPFIDEVYLNVPDVERLRRS